MIALGKKKKIILFKMDLIAGKQKKKKQPTKQASPKHK